MKSQDARDLLSKILREESSDRISIREILRHPYFTGKYQRKRFIYSEKIRVLNVSRNEVQEFSLLEGYVTHDDVILTKHRGLPAKSLKTEENQLLLVEDGGEIEDGEIIESMGPSATQVCSLFTNSKK
jgi:hypothetical protein